MKTLSILLAVGTLLLAACDKSREVRRNRGNRESMTPSTPLPLPGDTTNEHWSGPSSGKSERAVTDPLTGTPNQDPKAGPNKF